MTDTTIRLVSGKELDYLDPDPENIELHDIAHALARNTRYAGQIAGPLYSVAQHALFVSYIVAKHYHRPDLALAAVHHDDVEALTTDWPWPLKQTFLKLGFDYKPLERALEKAIKTALDIEQLDFHDPTIKEADILALQVESAVMKPGFDPDDPRYVDNKVDEETLKRLAPALPLGMRIEQAEEQLMKLHHKLQQPNLSQEILNSQVDGPGPDLPELPDDFEIPDALPEDWNQE
jgi:5'-deoxynucleotidase YfbR-like HD superfamily hydrolase